ncbi:MAG: MBL fold metallo-hydrolase [Chloroflexi bacterium]|nr:MBL fold metallo-hydrolase [Chloroflexota bacterium]
MEIATGLHHIKFELRPGAFGFINVLLGPRAGLIDTGTPPQPDRTLLPYLQQIGLEPERIAVIVNTHWHGDHMGGNAQLLTLTRASVAAHRLDAGWIEDPVAAVKTLRERYGKYHPNWGQSDEELARALWPASRVDRVLEEGDHVEVGDRVFQVIHTPGHTPGSISLLDAATGTLFCGDALQCEGQPGGLPNYTDLDPYLLSLEKIEQMEITTLIPQHVYLPLGKSVYQGREIRAFLRECHDALDRYDTQVMETLSVGRPLTLGEVMQGMHQLNSIEGPPTIASVSCTTAHLERLAARGTIRRLPPGPEGDPDEPTWAAGSR